MRAAQETAVVPCDSISGAAAGIHSFKQPSGDYFRHLPNLASAPPTSILASGVAPCLTPSHHLAPFLSLGIKKPLFVSGPLTNAPSSSSPSIHPSIYLSVHRSTRLSTCLPACLLVYPSVIRPRGPHVSPSPGSVPLSRYSSRATSTWPCERALPQPDPSHSYSKHTATLCLRIVHSRQRQGLKRLAIRAM